MFISPTKSASLADSVAVKTNSFVVIPKEVLDHISYFDANPPDLTKIFKIDLSKNSNIDFDYRVLLNNGDLYAKGFFGKKCDILQK